MSDFGCQLRKREGIEGFSVAALQQRIDTRMARGTSQDDYFGRGHRLGSVYVYLKEKSIGPAIYLRPSNIVRDDQATSSQRDHLASMDVFQQWKRRPGKNNRNKSGDT
jgi:hypothetical protein